MLNLLKKEAGVAETQPVPGSWVELFVHPDACTILTGTDIRDTSATPVMLDTGKPFMETRQLSYVRCEAVISGRIHRFTSSGLNLDPKALHLNLLQQERIRIWHDPANPAIHRFDFAFLPN